MEFENIHLGVLLVTVAVILHADYLAYRYFRGTQQLLERKHIQRTHHLVWAGLVGMIGTGVVLFIPRSTFLLVDPIFYVKMAFVFVLIFNAWVIGRVSHVASERSFASLGQGERQLLITAGALSWAGWITTAVIGLFFL